MKEVILKLTPKQLKKLESLQDAVKEAYHRSDPYICDHRGVIAAQVWPDRKEIVCYFLPHEEWKKLRTEMNRFSNAYKKKFKPTQ